MVVYVSTFCSLFFVFMYGSCSCFVVSEFVLVIETVFVIDLLFNPY
jgi:hypothetical protein